MLMKLNKFPTKAIFEKAPELPSICLTGDAFMLSFFFAVKLFKLKTKGDFESLETIGEQNTGKSLPIINSIEFKNFIVRKVS